MFLLRSDGACPCGNLELFGLEISTHCWRTSNNCNCKYSGVHIKDYQSITYEFTEEELLEIANLFAEYIRSAYHTEVSIIIEKE